MEPVRSALYLDFDNVFGALMKLDPRAAMSFAEEPRRWLDRLAAGEGSHPPRRWLVLRCYLNPAGWIPHPENNGSRLYFSRFRPALTDGGFEVVDCPRLSHTKNGADIRMVIDAVEALRADARYDDFVIASGDSDMTPLLVRLRAADRRTTLLSPSDSAVVLGAVADRLISGEDILELLEAPADDAEADAAADTATTAASSSSVDVESSTTAAEAKVAFAKFVTRRYRRASEPVNLATLAHEVRDEIGSVVSTSRWFGYGGFARALQSLDLPHVRMSQQFLWDSTRHAAPGGASRVPVETGPHLPEPVQRVTLVLRLPTLPQSSWPQIYESLGSFVSAYDFNLTEATRWARDRLVDKGVRVNRQAVSAVANGAAYGGCPLYQQPPPAAGDIASAFVANVLDRARAADVDLSGDEVDTVRSWFGAS